MVAISLLSGSMKISLASKNDHRVALEKEEKLTAAVIHQPPYPSFFLISFQVINQVISRC
jgi:hypothetical protein